MRVSVDVRGFDTLMSESSQKMSDWLDGVANSIVTDIRLSFNKSRGRAYQRGRRIHYASLPGNPPNIDTGALTNSLWVDNVNMLTRYIKDGVEYGYKLETGIGMRPRPFVRPVFAQWQAKIADDAQRNLGLDE
jgi:hypothetical protein